MCSEMRCSRFGRMNVGLGLSFFKYYSIRWPRTLRKVAILTPEFLFFFFPSVLCLDNWKIVLQI